MHERRYIMRDIARHATHMSCQRMDYMLRRPFSGCVCPPAITSTYIIEPSQYTNTTIDSDASFTPASPLITSTPPNIFHAKTYADHIVFMRSALRCCVEVGCLRRRRDAIHVCQHAVLVTVFAITTPFVTPTRHAADRDGFSYSSPHTSPTRPIQQTLV